MPERLIPMVLAGLLLCGCASAPPPPRQHSDRCEPNLEIDGRSYDGGGALRLLGIDGATDDGAVRDAAAIVEALMDEAVTICGLHTARSMDAARYAGRRDGIVERLAALAALVRAVHPREVKTGDRPAYVETLRALKPGSPSGRPTLTVTVTVNGLPLANGGEMHSGEGFRLVIDAPEPVWVYAVLVDSGNGATRLYPVSYASAENPVKGRAQAPPSFEKDLFLDAQTGTERILIFAQSERSPALEALLDGLAGDSPAPKKVLGPITRLAKARAAFTRVGGIVQGEVLGGFGLAAVEFVIVHR